MSDKSPVVGIYFNIDLKLNRMKSQSCSPLRDKSLQFSIRIVRLYQYLKEEKNEDILSRQVLKSGTNPGAMVREAQNSESGLDFIHKLGIAQKELGETEYWLELLMNTKYITEKEYQSLIFDASEIMRMLRSSILTRRKNLNK